MVARIRPLSERELAAGDAAVAQVSAEDSNVVLVRKLCSYTAFAMICFAQQRLLSVTNQHCLSSAPPA